MTLLQFDIPDGFMSAGGEDIGIAEGLGFFEHFVGEADFADFAQEAKLTEADRVFGKGFVLATGNNGESDAKIGTGIFDVHATGNIDKNIFGDDSKVQMFCQNGTDELETISGDALGYAARDGKGGTDN